jgi:hypothetical protein
LLNLVVAENQRRHRATNCHGKALSEAFILAASFGTGH